VACNRVRSEEAAKELIQEIFVNLWLKRKDLEINTFSSYIFSSLKYATIDYIRSQCVREKYINEIVKANTPFDNSTENRIALNELNEHIEKGIKNLPQKCRLVFTLKRDENYSLKQISEQLNISQKTVENHITKAIKLLKVDLRDFIMVLVIFILTR
jgi:RNA polymerase sigma-70 factor (family 1)